MRQALLTTTAVIACMMLAPPVEAHSASRHVGTDASFEADDGAGDRLIAVAQAALFENEEGDEESNEEDDGEEDEEGDEENNGDVDEEDGGDDPDQGDVQDDESTTADPDSGPATDDEDKDDSAVDGDDEDDGGEDEEDDSFPTVPGTLNATINGTATFQAGVMGDRTSGVQFRNETDIELNVRGKADNGLLYGLKVLFQTETGFESTGETTFDEAYVYLGGPWGRLEFGDTKDVVAGGLLVYAPGVGIGQIDGDYGSFARLSLDDYYPFYPDIGTSTKINYYTPRIGGFQAGVSYSPYLSDSGQSVVSLKPGRVSATSASTLPSPQRLSSGSTISQTVDQSSSLSPRASIRAAAPVPVQVSQVVEDDADEEEDDGEDAEDDGDEDVDDGTDEEPDTDEPDTPDEPDIPEEPDTPEEPGTPDEPGTGEPVPEVPPAVEQPQPETPVVEEPVVEEPGEEEPEEEPEEPDNGYRDVTTFAVNYQKEFENIAFSGSASVTNGNGYGPDFKDFTAWMTGIQIGISDFTIGGGFGKFDGYNDIDWQWNVGAIYEAGPFGIGAQYAWVEDVNGDHSWAAGIGVNYVLAPGLSLQADYVHSKVNFRRSENVNTADVVLLGLQLSF